MCALRDGLSASTEDRASLRGGEKPSYDWQRERGGIARSVLAATVRTHSPAYGPVSI